MSFTDDPTLLRVNLIYNHNNLYGQTNDQTVFKLDLQLKINYLHVVTQIKYKCSGAGTGKTGALAMKHDLSSNIKTKIANCTFAISR